MGQVIKLSDHLEILASFCEKGLYSSAFELFDSLISSFEGISDDSEILILLREGLARCAYGTWYEMYSSVPEVEYSFDFMEEMETLSDTYLRLGRIGDASNLWRKLSEVLTGKNALVSLEKVRHLASIDYQAALLALLKVRKVQLSDPDFDFFMILAHDYAKKFWGHHYSSLASEFEKYKAYAHFMSDPHMKWESVELEDFVDGAIEKFDYGLEVLELLEIVLHRPKDVEIDQFLIIIGTCHLATDKPEEAFSTFASMIANPENSDDRDLHVELLLRAYMQLSGQSATNNIVTTVLNHGNLDGALISKAKDIFRID